MKTKYAVINRVEKETEKAILVDADGQVWLPKSVVEIIDTPVAKVVALPSWLWFQHKIILSMTATEEQILEAIGIIK